MLSRKDVDRFWAAVDRSGGDNSCWEWQRGRIASGYGEFGANGTTLYTHRVAFELATGAPAPYYVCHTCDNPPCCNPAHLFSGTAQDNTDDKVRKGRQLRGESMTQSILTEADVVAMRVDYATNRTRYDVLAERFGVNKGTVGDAISGRTWVHAGGTIARRRTITAELAAEWRALFASGTQTKAQIARAYGFSRTTVCDLLNGKLPL